MDEGKIPKIEHGPEYVYMHLPDAFISLILTAPSAQVSLPENATLVPNQDTRGINIKLKNNNTWAKDKYNPNDLIMLGGSKTEIQSISWNGKEYSIQEVINKRAELLETYYASRIGGSLEAVEQVRNSTGLKRGEHLFRAITKSELYRLKEDKSKYYTQNDPSANFESETMYMEDKSQAKAFSAETSGEYSGHIIRWKIEDPILYRHAGMNPPRIIPMFSHFVSDLEISEDGINFQPLTNYLDNLNTIKGKN